MGMDAVIQQMRQTRSQLTKEIEAIDGAMKMLTDVAPQAQGVPPPLTNDRRRARAGDRAAASRLNGERKPAKRDYAVSKKVLDDVVAAARTLRDNGRSFIESVPGSFTNNMIAETSQRNVGTVRKALKQLIKDGVVEKVERMTWRQLGDTPQGPVDVYKLTEDVPAEHRGWQRQPALPETALVP